MDKFSFPYKPYDIQSELMESVFTTIRDKKVGIFESPTGTGKSLSVICSALYWLKNEAPPIYDETDDENVENASSGTSGGPSWMLDFKKKKKQEATDQKKKTALELREKLDSRIVDLRQNIDKRKKRKVEMKDLKESADSDSEFVLEDYTSDKENCEIERDDDEEEGSSKKEKDISVTKIIYCSRTHSQLSQFVEEITKTVYKDSVKCLPLGSRKSLCINEKVSKLTNDTYINDKCLDMQRNKSEKGYEKSKGSSCVYYDKNMYSVFTDHLYVKINDIEDVNHLGKKLITCPYYGTRKSMNLAEVVTMPYSMLVQESTRDAIGLDLKGNVIIIDEAHNLIEAINSVNSCLVTHNHIFSASKQLARYFDKYKHKLASKNFMYIQQIQSLLQALLIFLEKKPVTVSSSHDQYVHSQVLSINDFLCLANIDNYNLFKIDLFIKKSKICQKLHGFHDKIIKTEGDVVEMHDKTVSEEYVHKQVSHLQITHRFLMSLMNWDIDGRICVEKNLKTMSISCLKFILMNPAVHFNKIVKESRSVLLLGGTIQPVNDIINQLFNELPPDRINTLSLGHVVPSSNICVSSLTTGPSGIQYDFTYESRGTSNQINELGRLMVNLTTLVPQGLVVFLPSFSYMETLNNAWNKSGVITQIRSRRQIFWEPRSASQLETTLSQYEKVISNGGEALLLAVVGAKMSEGINFNDGLARCVVMVGLPYPNSFDPILKEKMKYLDEKQKERFGSSVEINAGRNFYENACMKAVNQSIGRAIRHRFDFAAILLVDYRYSKPHITSKLPKWIEKELNIHKTYGAACKSIGQFFRNHK